MRNLDDTSESPPVARLNLGAQPVVILCVMIPNSEQTKRDLTETPSLENAHAFMSAACGDLSEPQRFELPDIVTSEVADDLAGCQ